MEFMEWNVPRMPDEEKDKRHRAIRDLMVKNNIDSFIIAGHHGNYGSQAANFRYVSNYMMWFDDEYIVFPQKGEPFLIAFNTAHYNWANRVSWVPVKVRGLSGDRNYALDIATAIKEWGYESGTLGVVDMKTMPASIYTDLVKRLPGAQFLDSGPLFAQLRKIKSPNELAFIEKSGECADKGFEAIKAIARPGINDRDVWNAMESAITGHGAEPPSFSLYVSGRWEEKGINLPYGPIDRVLKKGDMVMNEITPSYGGYWSQICRPVCLGEPSDLIKKEFDVHAEIYHTVRDLLKPGNVYGDIDNKVKEIAAKRGYHPQNAFSLQHIGLGIIDVIPKDTVLEPGMVFVNHPWIEFPAANPTMGGHIIGDTYIITNGEPKCINKMPLEIAVV